MPALLLDGLFLGLAVLQELLGAARVLTLTPRTEDEAALMTVVGWWRRFPVTRALLSVVAGVFIWASVTLLFAPDSQLFTQGTKPAFTLFPPTAWAVGFAAGGAAVLLLLRRYSLGRMFAAWCVVLPVEAMWLAASAFAVAEGGGSALGVVFFSGLFLFTLIAAVAVAVDFSSGKR